MSIAIKSGAKVLYQWERGVALTASTPCDILRISREDDRVTDDLYPVISGSTGTALIPDRMLTESGYLHVSRIDHADGSERVLETVRILVRHAAKPQNTVSSTKEIGDMQALRMQMAALERAAREGKFDGKDGITPHVGENLNWWFGDVDTGIPASGEASVTKASIERALGYLPTSESDIPKKTSDLNNDSGFITKLVEDLVNYYTKSETLAKDEINQLVSKIPKFSISVVSSLPSSNISNTTVYLVKSGTGGDLYTEYINVNGIWEILGSQRVDLTGYATESWVRGQLDDIPRKATPQMYGAKGDGVTDDTAAFRAALAAERVVFVPGGTYKLSSGIVIGANSMLELSQDTVLEFTNTTGNCINLGMLSNLKGNHATIKVPYWFEGNVLYSYTNDQTSADINAVPPWTKWDPQWKSGRYVTDINICKDDSSQGSDRGFHYAVNPGDCRGAAVYLSADYTAGKSTFMWGVHYSGLRIAGAFSYGIRAVNYDNGWNHEMRIDAFIDACEIGVSLEDCSNVYVSAAIQPRRAYSLSKVYAPYAKHGIKLVNSKNVDLSGCRVWDWENEDKPSTTENEKMTLWTNGGEYQSIAMYGNCTGAIVNDFQWNTKGDTRDRIYTDNDQNLETLTVLQEPIDRWFKVIGGDPYFTNGVDNIKLLRENDLNKLITITAVKNYTDVLEQATDTDGVTVFNGIGYQIGKRFSSLGDGVKIEDSTYYMTTGFITVTPGQTINAKDLNFDDKGKTYAGIVYYNANRERIGSQSITLINNPSGYWIQSYTRTTDGFSLQFPDNGTVKGLAYVRMVFPMTCVGRFPTMAINEPAEPVYKRALADEVVVKGENIVGTPGQITPDWVATKEEVGGDTIIIPEQKITYGMWSNLQVYINAGITYDVYINGTVYACTAYNYDGGIVLGNYTIAQAGADVPHNNEPFYIFWAGGSATAGMFDKDSTLSYPITIKVTDHVQTVYNKMPVGYLPEGVVMSVNGVKPDANGNVAVPSGGLHITDDGEGNVTITASAGVSIIDDGNGNVVIA
jgi:hypothetical protein